MDLLNTTGPKSMNSIRRLNRGNFIFQVTVLKFNDLLAGCKLTKNTKFQHSMSKITPARTKKSQGHGCDYHCSYWLLISHFLLFSDKLNPTAFAPVKLDVAGNIRVSL